MAKKNKKKWLKRNRRKIVTKEKLLKISFILLILDQKEPTNQPTNQIKLTCSPKGPLGDASKSSPCPSSLIELIGSSFIDVCDVPSLISL